MRASDVSMAAPGRIIRRWRRWSGGKPKKLKLAKKASDRFEKRDDNKKDNKALR